MFQQDLLEKKKKHQVKIHDKKIYLNDNFHTALFSILLPPSAVLMTEAAPFPGVFERAMPAGLASPNFSCRLSTSEWTGLESPGVRAGTHTGDGSSSGTDGSSMYSGADCLLIGLFPVL